MHAYSFVYLLYLTYGGIRGRNFEEDENIENCVFRSIFSEKTQSNLSPWAVLKEFRSVASSSMIRKICHCITAKHQVEAYSPPRQAVSDACFFVHEGELGCPGLSRHSYLLRSGLLTLTSRFTDDTFTTASAVYSGRFVLLFTTQLWTRAFVRPFQSRWFLNQRKVTVWSKTVSARTNRRDRHRRLVLRM